MKSWSRDSGRVFVRARIGYPAALSWGARRLLMQREKLMEAPRLRYLSSSTVVYQHSIPRCGLNSPPTRPPAERVLRVRINRRKGLTSFEFQVGGSGELETIYYDRPLLNRLSTRFRPDLSNWYFTHCSFISIVLLIFFLLHCYCVAVTCVNL